MPNDSRIQEAFAAERRVNDAPLRVRQENRKSFQTSMSSDPATVAERLSWIFDGHHGYGEMMRAREILSHKRMNRVAALTHLVAIYEYQCPAVMAVDAWKKLTASQQAELKRAIEVVIEAAEKEIAEE